MCKSQAEGGQRCSTDARADYEAASLRLSNARAVGEPLAITEAEVAVNKHATEYASTRVGSDDLHRQLFHLQEKIRFHNKRRYRGRRDWDERYAGEVAQLKRWIDDGAHLARVNRAVEDAYRATQGKAPLDTPLPESVAEEHQRREREKAAREAEAQRHRDPLGLRSAQTATITATQRSHLSQLQQEQERTTAALHDQVANYERVCMEAIVRRRTKIAAAEQQVNEARAASTAAHSARQQYEDDVYGRCRACHGTGTTRRTPWDGGSKINCPTCEGTGESQ